MQNQSPTSNNSNSLILLPKNDYCHRYRPSYDVNTFQQQIEGTQEELVNYFPTPIFRQYNAYRSTTKMITYGFWASSVAFAVFTHKIRIVQRLIGEKKWLMFGLRMSILIFPYLMMQKIMEDAEEEEIKTIYQQLKPHYIRYKLTGDITQLSGKVELEEPQQFSKVFDSLDSENAKSID